MQVITPHNLGKREFIPWKADQTRNLRQKRDQKRRMIQELSLFITKGGI